MTAEQQIQVTGSQGQATPQTAAPQADAAPAAHVEQKPAPAAPATWDAFLDTLPEETKKLYDTHTAGLKTALQSERQQRSELGKQIQALSKQAADGSEMKKSLETLQGELELVTQRADFFEAAARPEIGCSNPALAWLAAREGSLIDGKGKIQWDALKQSYPELFRQRVPAVQAGAGTQTPPAPRPSMNDFIRAAAGKRA